MYKNTKSLQMLITVTDLGVKPSRGWDKPGHLRHKQIFEPAFSGISAVTGHHLKQCSHVNYNLDRALVWSFEFRTVAQEPGKGSFQSHKGSLGSQRVIRVTKAHLIIVLLCLELKHWQVGTPCPGESLGWAHLPYTDFAFSLHSPPSSPRLSVADMPALPGKNFTTPSHHQNSRTGTKESFLTSVNSFFSSDFPSSYTELLWRLKHYQGICIQNQKNTVIHCQFASTMCQTFQASSLRYHHISKEEISDVGEALYSQEFAQPCFPASFLFL